MDEASPEEQETAEGLRVLRFDDPHRALGRAVGQLIGEPAFARLRFGPWSRVLIGQINRGHYFFVAEGGAIRGFVGWALPPTETAEAWLAGAYAFSDAESRGGDTMVINAWQAERPDVSRFMARCVIRACAAAGARQILARRSYADRRLRPMRLPIAQLTRAAAQGS